MPVSTPGLPNILPPASGAPVLSGISIQPDQSFLLTFGASPGHTYRLEFKDDLNEETWRPRGTNQFANGPLQFFSDIPDALHRFYRVVLVE